MESNLVEKPNKRNMVDSDKSGKYTEKENKVFATLSGIGIIMVVSAHVNSVLNLFKDFFPYNSFFMPMFIFISGYFFKDKNVESVKNTKKYICKKFTNLLCYYFVCNIFFGLIELLLYKMQLHNYRVKFNFKNIFISPFIDGQQFWINAPAWFIPTLFMVEITFLGIRKLQLILKHKSEYITLICMIILNMAMVYISKNVTYSKYLLPFVKLGFFLPFFQIGKIYKDVFEAKEKKIKSRYVIFLTLIINLVCIKLYKNINFISLYNMGGFKKLPFYIPLVTSITGIWFWLRISRIFAPVLMKSDIFRKISNNTKAIMMYHIFCMLIINVILYCSKDILNLSGFDIEKFKSSPMWYRYWADTPQLAIFYVIFGIVGALLIRKLEIIIKNFFNLCKEGLNNN